MTTIRHYLADFALNCATCGDGAARKCPAGHPICESCIDELCPCAACLEAEADGVRGMT